MSATWIKANVAVRIWTTHSTPLETVQVWIGTTSAIPFIVCIDRVNACMPISFQTAPGRTESDVVTRDSRNRAVHLLDNPTLPLERLGLGLSTTSAILRIMRGVHHNA
jgi:hypothetical protein